MPKLPITYVVIWEDRHCEPTAHLFHGKDAAIAWAREKLTSLGVSNADWSEKLPPEIAAENFSGVLNSDMLRSGWVYSCTYSCEGDSIRVVETSYEDAA